MRRRFSISNGTEELIGDGVVKGSEESGEHFADCDELIEELVVEGGIEVFEIA